MQSHPRAHSHFDNASDLNKRVALVMEVHNKLGYVSRQSLIEIYGLTQQQAGSLMRDFIHAHAKDLQWNMKLAHYMLKR